MLLKNKFYASFVILLYLFAFFLIANENIISNSLGTKMFYMTNFLIGILITIGITKKVKMKNKHLIKE